MKIQNEIKRVGMIAIVSVLMMVAIASAVPFQKGDVFLSTGPNMSLGGNEVRHFSGSGTYIETLIVPETTYTDTGMTFDAFGNLYVTLFGFENVSKFNNTGVFQNYFGSGYGTDPESIVFDSSGNAYVGQADGSHKILKFDSDGNMLTNFSPNTESRGTDWVDLAADQRTIYYTSESSSVKRFDTVTNTQLSDFANASMQKIAGPCYALRIRPGKDEVMVACSNNAYRLNSTSIIQTYPAPTGSNNLFGLNLDPDGTSFWTADLFNGKAYKFDIESGNLLMTIDSGMNASNNLAGIAVFGEITASKPTGSISGENFNDSNNNGKKDVGEAGLANWVITLKNDAGNVITTTTDNQGNYSFPQLPDGNYTIGEVLQTGWIQTAPGATSDGSATYKVEIKGGNQITGKDFGNAMTNPIPVSPVILSGFGIAVGLIILRIRKK